MNSNQSNNQNNQNPSTQANPSDKSDRTSQAGDQKSNPGGQPTPIDQGKTEPQQVSGDKSSTQQQR